MFYIETNVQIRKHRRDVLVLWIEFSYVACDYIMQPLGDLVIARTVWMLVILIIEEWPQLTMYFKAYTSTRITELLRFNLSLVDTGGLSHKYRTGKGALWPLVTVSQHLSNIHGFQHHVLFVCFFCVFIYHFFYFVEFLWKTTISLSQIRMLCLNGARLLGCWGFLQRLAFFFCLAACRARRSFSSLLKLSFTL